MSSTSSNNKRLARNTGTLYMRMFLIMLIHLYSSRIILNILGVEDYGIYNVIAGLITLCNVFVGAVNVSISRFITYELGKGNGNNVSKVFSASINVQAVLVTIIFIVAETIGVWFLNNKIIIPESRLVIANYVYQSTVFTSLFMLLSAPFNAALIAYEKISAFAVISTLYVLMNLLAALSLAYVPFDRLIMYSILLMLSSFVTLVMYCGYCNVKLKECRYKYSKDFTTFKEIFSYAGWTYIGNSAAMLRDQGGNILLNLFYGPTVNAARGLAMQIQVAVNQFSTNFTTALNPQITKSYACGDKKRMFFLIHSGSLIGFYLLLLISIPMIFYTPNVLSFWLGDKYPSETILFVRLSVLFILSESVSNPLITAASATGIIRNYQIVVGGIQFLNLPLSYFVLKMGLSSMSVYVVAIIISQACFLSRLIMLREMIGLSIRNFMSTCFLRIITVAIMASSLSYYLVGLEVTDLMILCIKFVSCISITIIVILIVGLNSRERKFLFSKFKR